MQLSVVLLFLLSSHVVTVTAWADCHRDRDKDHRSRENCTALGFSDVVAGFEPTTKVMLFPNNLFSRLSWSSFQIFTKIYEIDLTGNKIPEVTSSVTPILPTLSVLRLGSNRLTSLSDNSFSACPALTELYLENNTVHSLSNHTFSGLSKLEILDLSSNHIKVLPELMLHPLRALEALYLEKNEIRVMPDDWFSKKEEVPYLYLSANPWACFCSLGYLRRYLDDYELNVYMRDGPIIKGAVESVVCASPQRYKDEPVINLEESDLCPPATISGPTGDNKPITVPYSTAATARAGCHRDRDKDHRSRENCTALGFSHVVAGFEPTTKVMLFPNNLFSRLSWSSFQIFTKIYEIDLTGNKIPEVTSSVTPILPTLSVLRLGSNRLTSLSDNSFSACPALTELYLENNAVHSLSNHTFSGLSKLEILDLSSNHIKVLPELMLHPLRALETLYLEKNEIRVMPDDWFSKKEEVPYLYLSANPWACFCSLGYLRRYLNNYEFNVYMRDGPIIKGAVESVVCASPQRYKDEPVINLEESDLCPPATISGPAGDNKPITVPYSTAATARASCHRDRDKDHRSRENCTALGFSHVVAGFEPTTKVMLFPNNLFSRLSWSSFQIFTKIYEIDLTGNKIPEVTSSVTPILPTLSVLRLGSNRLTSLSDNSFSACPALTELYLENNAVHSLSDHTFSGLSKLAILDLSSNHIKVLPELMLHPLRALETLYLEKNEIRVMPDDWFSKKEEVPYLYLSANPWACFCSLGYLRRYLNNYEFNVYMRDGPIIKGAVESVVCASPQRYKDEPVINLEESDLCPPATISGPAGDNKPITVPYTTAATARAGCHRDRDKDHRSRGNCTALGFSHVVAGFEPTTKVMLFPNNLFSRLSWSSFQIFTKIYEIDLTGNKIPEVTSSVTPILPTLSVLRLGSNRLTSLSDNSFSACPALTELYLENNAVHSLSDHTFSGLSKLEILDLSSNHIKVLPELMLHPLRALETLYLEKNEIRVMPDDWFSKKEEVPYLYLSANPWACFCSLGYLRRYLNNYEFNVYMRDGPIIKGAVESVVCASPQRYKDEPVINLEESDLCPPATESGPTGDNVLTTVPDAPTPIPTTPIPTTPIPTTPIPTAPAPTPATAKELYTE